MTNPHHRSKHRQSKNVFRIIIDGVERIVRPVDGAAWFDQPGIESGVVHLVDEAADFVAVVETGFFDRNAKRADWRDVVLEDDQEDGCTTHSCVHEEKV